MSNVPLATTASSSPTTLPLRGRSLRLSKTALGLATAVVVILVVTGIPLRYDKVRLADTTIRNPEFRNLIAAGVAPRLAATLDIVAMTVPFVVMFVGGLVLFMRASDSREVVYLAATLIFFGAGFSALTSVHRTPGPVMSQSLAGLAATVVNFLASVFPWNAMFWLPQGRFVSRWTAWWAALQTVALGGLYFFISYPRSHDLVNVLALPAVIMGIYAQISHYRMVRDPAARQQIKWAVVGIVLAAAGFLVTQPMLLVGNQPGLGSRSVAALARLVVGASQIGLVVCMAIAIHRYHLWRVDLVINRSLVYGAVALAVVLIFLGGGLTLQRVLGKDKSGVAFAISIVAAAIAFAPARQQAQRFVDRRLFGFRFDLVELGRAQKLPPIKNAGRLTGQTLGAYRLLGVLGRGGMGEVYQADADGRRVAIKIVPDELSGQAEFLHWFKRESEALAALDHPNIVRLHESGESAGVHYMVLDFIDGRELSGVIRDRGQVPLSEARQLVRDCAAALEYAHRRGLVHRDIKPSNIMVRRTIDDRLEAVLMDFGVAKIREGQTVLTSTGAVGTIQYMAPEQILAAKTVDARADIYAFGVTVYEMVTGELPFKGNPGQLVFAHLQEQPRNPRELMPELPESVADAIMRSLQKKPEERFQTAHDFAAAFNGSQ